MRRIALSNKNQWNNHLLSIPAEQVIPAFADILALCRESPRHIAIKEDLHFHFSCAFIAFIERLHDSETCQERFPALGLSVNQLTLFTRLYHLSHGSVSTKKFEMHLILNTAGKLQIRKWFNYTLWSICHEGLAEEQTCRLHQRYFPKDKINIQALPSAFSTSATTPDETPEELKEIDNIFPDTNPVSWKEGVGRFFMPVQLPSSPANTALSVKEDPEYKHFPKTAFS